MTTHPMLLVTQQGPWKDIKIEANDYFKEKNQIKLRYLAQNSPFTGGEKKKKPRWQILTDLFQVTQLVSKRIGT